MATEASAPARWDDAGARRRALEAPGSVLVCAPAGSGKTELLTQRFLRLLATVEKPEAIVALTFTRKAVGEMRQRLLQALASADGEAPPEPHKRLTWELARAARARDREKNWDLENAPARLQIMTIDGLALKLAVRLPWLARLGPAPRPTDDAQALYRAAARATLAHADADGDLAGAAGTLLAHLDADLDGAETLVADLLARRDAWLPLLLNDISREQLDAELAAIIAHRLDQTRALLDAEGVDTAEIREAGLDIGRWAGIAAACLTKEGELRKRNNPWPHLSARACGALHAARQLPDPAIGDAAWNVRTAVLKLLKRAAAELTLVFAERRQCDFTEITLAALDALGTADLADTLDARLQHLFVDEFQDTSRVQYQLIQRLTGEWSDGDGRTLFLVGDPEQSIYRFRGAEVDLFHQVARSRQLGTVKLERVDLSRNFRSGAALVSWIEQHFESRSVGDTAGGEATVHALASTSHEYEAEHVADLVDKEVKAGMETVGVLVHSRKHVAPIRAALRRLNIAFEGRKLLPLNASPVVLDLMALTRALFDTGDRVAWLALLRAPWCGLTLADLYALCAADRDTPVPALWRQRREHLSPDGAERAAAVLSVIEAAADQRGRWPVRALVEWCWEALGGPACAASHASDAAAFFERLDAAGAHPDLAALAASLEGLFAPDQHAPRAQVQIMTVHQAKGLEFDAVILPGLSRKLDPGGPGPLLRWVQAPAGEGETWLVAAKPSKAQKNERSIYQLVKRLDHDQGQGERKRLLYVAMTRPRHRLHLVAAMPLKRDGTALAHPESSSPLAQIWPTLRAEFQRQFELHRQTPPATPVPGGAATPTGYRHLRRVRAAVAAPVPPPPPPAVGRSDALAPGGWERAAGTAVHALLRQMAETGELTWNEAELERQLRAAGVRPAQHGAARQRARLALTRLLADERGHWLLAPHAEARHEWALSGVSGGGTEHRVIDRSFVESGVRWIIDYKITAPEAGANAAEWLDEELARYRPQLENYARIVAELEGSRALRCGIYFPLTGDWREWEPSA